MKNGKLYRIRISWINLPDPLYKWFWLIREYVKPLSDWVVRSIRRVS